MLIAYAKSIDHVIAYVRSIDYVRCMTGQLHMLGQLVRSISQVNWYASNIVIDIKKKDNEYRNQ